MYETKGKSTSGKIKERGYSGKRGINKVRQALDYGGGHENNIREQKFIGYTDCNCNAGWESGIVLDPFMGVGTTAIVAKKQGKRY